jgi:hypothetical protein
VVHAPAAVRRRGVAMALADVFPARARLVLEDVVSG